MLSSFETLAANAAVGRAGLLVLSRKLSPKCMNRTWVLLGGSLMWHWVLRSRKCDSKMYFSRGSELWKWVSKDTVVSELSFTRSSRWHGWSLNMESSREVGDTTWRQPGARVSADRDTESAEDKGNAAWAQFCALSRQYYTEKAKKLCLSLLINFILLLKSRKTNQPNKNPQIGF